jgi:hypothetical protein
MDIHIRQPIEYEKIVSGNPSKAIELTRHRMVVQQLLDSRDNDANLKERLKSYCHSFDVFCAALRPHVKLQKQPSFHWVVAGQPIHSSCWKFEAVVPRIVLSELCHTEGVSQLQNNDYKAAAKSFKVAEQSHMETIQHLRAWKWRIPGANHHILQQKWHYSAVHHLQSLQHLCMVSVGLDQETAAKTLYVVAQRATAAAAKSVAAWPDRHSTLQMCEGLQHLFSSHILWNREEYGGSIHRLNTWLLPNSIDTFHFDIIEREFKKVPFLTRERRQINNGAYFDMEAAVTPLPTPQELIHMESIDVPHPPSTRSTPMEPAPAEGHD